MCWIFGSESLDTSSSVMELFEVLNSLICSQDETKSFITADEVELILKIDRTERLILLFCRGIEFFHPGDCKAVFKALDIACHLNDFDTQLMMYC